MAAVARLDDGHSDPASVAYGLVGKCAEIYAALTEAAASQYSTDAGRQNIRSLMRANEVKAATSAVLSYRADHRRDR